ncbi:MAG: BNR-4 repeat-containing protein [Candidatus Latescibacteria bacterium]|nr:BNR-4 repeat-containing protein [Candidatus Latescibacterota bacterium]
MMIHNTKHFIFIPVLILELLFSFCCSAFSDSNSLSMLYGGCGGIYFYAPQGELWVEVAKQDLNKRSNKTYLRAILFGPDRTVLDEVTIPDDGLSEGSGQGPVKRTMLRTNVERPGIYGLNITVSEDRYGEHMSWAFRTNCKHYLVETSRGHRDARHEEPLVLRDEGREGDVCFLPEPTPFSIEISDIPGGITSISLYDTTGKIITSLSISTEGMAKQEISSGVPRNNTPWRLHLPNCRATINIDGVTRWTYGEPWENLSLWTPDLSSWFNFHDNRWLLTPYNRTIYDTAGKQGAVQYTVHNNGTKPKRVSLAIEFDSGQEWPVTLSTGEVLLKADEAKPVSLEYSVPANGDEWTCHIRATVQDESRFSTWSSLTLRKGEAPAAKPVGIPIKLEPYRHENEQFGYLPDYPLDNQVYFDYDNQPYILVNDGLFITRGGAWQKTTDARRGDNGETIPIRPAETKVAFDRDNDIYFLGRAGGTTMLLHSRDHGATFTAWAIPGSGSFDIEQFSGHNHPAGPPPLARFHETARDPNMIWRRINDLDLFLPVKKPDGSIEIGDPIPVSKQSIGLSVHSGIPSSMVSRGDKVHITWGEATDPADNAPGVPAFVATYDRTTGTLSKPSLAGYGPPANDIHNTPCITMDSKGYLHVLVGTHGRTFKYTRSLEPNSASGGWTQPVDVGPGLNQTYVGMVCDSDNTLHLVFRLWLNDTRYFPAGHYANLAYMSKKSGEAWSEARPLVVAPFSEYSIFYHRLTIDRNSTLFLSYDYWSTFWFYRTDHRGNRRSLLMSSDGGNIWQLAPSKELITE